MPVAPEVLKEIALSPQEYERIVALLGREPNPVELGMFGALWSEHCGYKNSKPLLRMFPNESPRVLVRAGEENAGAVDIGDGTTKEWVLPGAANVPVPRCAWTSRAPIATS